MRLLNDLSTCTLRIGKTVFSLRRVSLGSHGASSLLSAGTYSSVTLPMYCKNTKCLAPSSCSDWTPLISGGDYYGAPISLILLSSNMILRSTYTILSYRCNTIFHTYNTFCSDIILSSSYITLTTNI